MKANVLDIEDVLVIIPKSLVEEEELQVVALGDYPLHHFDESDDHFIMQLMCMNQHLFPTVDELIENVRHELGEMLSKEIVNWSMVLPMVDDKPLHNLSYSIITN